MRNRARALPTRRSMAGVSLVELMIAVTLGLMVLATLASVFANTSASRNELERTSRQIENGRFAMELITDELRLAGFYGELDIRQFTPPGVLPDPCSTVPADWAASMPVHVQAYDNGVGAPGCVPTARKAGTLSTGAGETPQSRIVDLPAAPEHTSRANRAARFAVQ